MIKKGQSLSEYLVVFVAVSIALSAMQVYFRRSIQAAVKISADQIRSQRQGVASFDPDLDYLVQDVSRVNSTSNSRGTEIKLPGGSVARVSDELAQQEGGVSLVITQEKE